MIYYYNGSPIQVPFTITSNRQAFQVETLSLKQTTLLTEAQRWELSFTILMNDDEAGTFGAHTWGFHNIKTMIMPQLAGPSKRYTFNGLLKSNTSHAGGTSSIVLTSSAQSGTAIIPAGTFINFDNHSKTYVTKNEVTFVNGASDVAIGIFPSLVAGIPSNTEMKLGSNCLLTYKLDFTSGQGITFTDGILSSPGTIKLIESL
jgi:hypothetical protein